MVAVNQKQIMDILHERGLEHLYTDDIEQLSRILKDEQIITGLIYEPKFKLSTFDGVHKLSNYRVLFVLKD